MKDAPYGCVRLWANFGLSSATRLVLLIGSDKPAGRTQLTVTQALRMYADPPFVLLHLEEGSASALFVCLLVCSISQVKCFALLLTADHSQPRPVPFLFPSARLVGPIAPAIRALQALELHPDLVLFGADYLSDAASASASTEDAEEAEKEAVGEGAERSTEAQAAERLSVVRLVRELFAESVMVGTDHTTDVVLAPLTRLLQAVAVIDAPCWALTPHSMTFPAPLNTSSASAPSSSRPKALLNVSLVQHKYNLGSLALPNDRFASATHNLHHIDGIEQDANPAPPPQQRPLLQLVMIVKDEARGIVRTLQSVADVIDHYTILDTGSSDATAALVRHTLRAVPGRVVHEPFRDFSTTRNRALQLAGQTSEF